MASNALSLHLGLCGALTDTGPRYLPCSTQHEPAPAEEPEAVPVAADAGSEATPVQSGSRAALYDPNMQERKDEIDALRARVDVILNKMVQNSGDDVQRLRQKIAEMRSTAPPAAPQKPATRSITSWSPGDALCAPLSPMTATTNTTNITTATNTTGNSATPSADTELHANLTKKSPAQNEASILATTPITNVEEERDDDDDIDDMEFDFKLAPLSLSKSAQMAELGSFADPRPPKPSKDPPASLKASESMLPDPGGDDSYCSEDRADSPPPGSVLYEAAALKAESVIEREHQEQRIKQQQQKKTQHKEEKKKESSQQNQRARTPPTPEAPADGQSRVSKTSKATKSTKARETQGSAAQPIVADSGKANEKKEGEAQDSIRKTTSKNSDPPATPSVQRNMVDFDGSKSPPPPVANVNIPRILKPSDGVGAPSVAGGSHSDSSLTRPPSPTPLGDITMVEEVREQRIRDPYGDKGVYTGVLVKRRPHGRGTMKYDDGRHYEGHWNHGRWHGVGRAIFANNDIFEGSYDMDQRHGHGMYQWNDGRVYTGQFFQDQRQGRGTYTWPDGAVYQGEFKSGHRHGQGMYRFADGSVYTGEWENGKYHGVGECRWSDGRSYRGEWKEGRANGYGVETRPNGTIRHDGEWKDDRPIRDNTSKRRSHNDGQK